MRRTLICLAVLSLILASGLYSIRLMSVTDRHLSIGLLAQEKEPAAKAKATAKAAGGTVEGTLVDAKCYMANPKENIKNDHGSMVGCGTACAKGGNPVGIVDSKGGFYTVLGPAPKMADYIGMQARITGKADASTKTVIPNKVEVKKNGTWEEVKLKAMM